MGGAERDGPSHTEGDHQLRAVLRVLNEHDPEGLLDVGAPADEYTPEATHFARLTGENHTITTELVAEVWAHWFGNESRLLTTAPVQELEQLAARLAVASVSGGSRTDF
ncbi:hypothetical protein [Halopolyspora algeriensis]|nr:hypothetical protein [Halopolyspora algeriensis]